ncbi:3'-5' exonuclease [Pseudidiomarina insulisalsae]|uniref:Exonuclease n=1 Tax=Pseudidiomarina insulisalsae TaxID=575789 RepID=A0A432YQV5_9GAMM|nr:3'-5' exonuclease [Pseudidiomarina insulisalsae]RUO63656.1 exonuclease [Pseudidiomarina insulisalsae]
MNQQLILVVDLEATCWEGNVEGLDRKQTVDDMEIIEFGCVVATFDGTAVAEKSLFVQPQVHPQLSDFCQELTSIRQSDVDKAPRYPQAVTELNSWLKNFELQLWGSWGDYDRRQIKAEQERHKLAPEFCALPHVNLKKQWRKDRVGSRKSGLMSALQYHDLEFQGSYHRGIDDALNIARLLPFINLT